MVYIRSKPQYTYFCAPIREKNGKSSLTENY